MSLLCLFCNVCFIIMPRNCNPPIRVDCRVSGRHGELEDPQPSTIKDSKKRKRCRKKLICGQVVYFVGPNLYRVLWDDGGYTDCKSTTLKYEGEGTPLLEKLVGRVNYLIPQMKELDHLRNSVLDSSHPFVQVMVCLLPHI